MAWDLPVPDLTIARDSSLVVWVIEHQPHKTVDSGARKPDLWPFVSKLSSARRPAHHCPVLPCRCATPSGIAVHPCRQGFRLRLTVSERCDCANAARAPMGPGQYAPALASIAHDRIRRPKQWVSVGVDRLARLVLAFRALQTANIAWRRASARLNWGLSAWRRNIPVTSSRAEAESTGQLVTSRARLPA